MLACTDTMTLIKCDGETYTTAVISGVSWYDKTQVKVEDSGLVYANTVKVRIPQESLGNLLPEVGDHIVLGEIKTALNKPADLAAYHPRKVIGVGNNLRGRLAHLLVVGE